MERRSPSRLGYALLLACIPASMLLVVWLPVPALQYLRQHARWLYGLLDAVAPLFPSWPQYFGVQTLAAALVACGTFFWLKSPKLPKPSWGHLFVFLVVGYALWAAASCAWSTWPYGSRGHVIREMPFYVLCIAAALLCHTPGRWMTIARMFAVCAVAQAALQSIVIVSSAVTNGWPLGKAFLQRTIFYSNPNYSCAGLITAALILVGLVSSAVLARPEADGDKQIGRACSRHAGWIAASVLPLAVLAFVFVMAGALAGYIAAAVAVGAYLLCVLPIPRKGLLVLVLAGAAVAGGAVMLSSQPFLNRALDKVLAEESTAHVRVMYWLAAGDAFAQKPVAGWGAGTFAATYPRFKPPLASKLRYTRDKRPEHPHNEFVRVASELGLVGLTLYLAILGSAFVVSYMALRRQPTRVRLVGYAMWAGALAFVVQSAFGQAPMEWSFSSNFWLILGMLASSAWWGRHPTDATQPADAPAGRRWLAWLAVLLVGWAWWSWGLGSYRSMVCARRAEEARKMLGQPNLAQRAFGLFRENLDMARGRMLWPTQTLYHDYVVGWFLTDNGQYAEAEEYLTANVLRPAPEMLKVRLLLARCRMAQQDVPSAVEHAAQYIARNPYDLGGYQVLAAADLRGAAARLEEHVDQREGYDDPAKVRYLLYLYSLLGEWKGATILVDGAATHGMASRHELVMELAGRLQREGRKKRFDELLLVFGDILGVEPGPAE